MKTITIKTLWAVLIMLHQKSFETRTWAPGYRGKLAIHASKSLSPLEKKLFYTEPFYSVFRHYGYTRPEDLKKYCGKVIATCYFTGAYKTEQIEVSEQERAFGDFSEGRYAWRLEGVMPLETPVAVRGQLGLWNWETMGGVKA